MNKLDVNTEAHHLHLTVYTAVLDTATRLFHSLEEEPQGHIFIFQCYESM